MRTLRPAGHAPPAVRPSGVQIPDPSLSDLVVCVQQPRQAVGGMSGLRLVDTQGNHVNLRSAWLERGSGEWSDENSFG
jgi:hypothetical protein